MSEKMSFVFHLVVDSFHRYMFKEDDPRAELPSEEFHKMCAELCACNTVDNFIGITSSILTWLTSPSEPVNVFQYTKSNSYRHASTSVNYSTDLIPTSSQKTWHTVTLKGRDELVKLGIYETDSSVLILPIYPEKHTQCDIVFLTGHVKDIQHPELLSILHQHVTACYSRLYKHSRISNNKERCLTNLFWLCADLDEDNATAIQVKVMSYLAEDLSCETCCLLLAVTDISSFICHVVGNEILESEHYFQLKDGFFGKIARGRQPRILQHFTTNEREILQSLFKVNTKSFMCVPIISPSSKEIVALLCACNKNNDEKFSMSDVSSVQTVLRYTWSLLTSSLALQKERKVKDECQAMLQIARNLFTHLDDVTILLGEIIQEARTLTNAERCSVFLVDKESNELVAKVFDGILTVDESLDPRQYDFEGMNEVRLPLSQGIAGHVATTGKTLNITDAYSHPLFYRGIDEATGFKTRNILCFPIKDSNGVVVGVSQLCNKIKGHCFTQYDVDLAERLSVFSGISISHSLLYKQVIEVQCRNQLANELMTYHMKVKEDAVQQCLALLPLSTTSLHPDFDKFIYPPRSLADDSKCSASVHMYMDLGLVSCFHIPTRTLAKFILMVREGYRNPPYHNWDHAFSVAHHAYLLAKNLNLSEVFGELEVLALLTACFCHDLDHRGTNNAFQVSSKSTLAALYSSEGSVLERHHFAQAMCILNSGSCNIFENMSKVDYVRVLDLTKDIILATDLAHHLRILPKLEELSQAKVDPSTCNEEQKMLLVDLCMTACDLSDQTKDWKNTKNTAHLVYKEFFSQGDIEKSMGTRPALINDRERACVPELQVNFMEHIARPVYRIIGSLFPAYQEVVERVDANFAKWKLVEQKFKQLGLPNTHCLDFMTEEFDRELFETVKT